LFDKKSLMPMISEPDGVGNGARVGKNQKNPESDPLGLYSYSVQKKRIKTMKLTYRGNSYVSSPVISTPVSETTAIYRGQRYNLHQPLAAIAKPVAAMTYRGVSYTGYSPVVEGCALSVFA
jgi:hypothetical protein